MNASACSAEDDLIISIEDLIAAAAELGSDRARRVLDDWLERTTRQTAFAAAMIRQLDEALMIAQEIAGDGVTRSVTIRDGAEGSRVHFSWGGKWPAPSATYAGAIFAAVRTAVGERGPTLALPLSTRMEPVRRWDVGEHVGHCFPGFDDEAAPDYDGWALTIELQDEAEARIVAHWLHAMWPETWPRVWEDQS